MKTITFGRYCQEANKAPTPIEWDVLTKEKDKYLLVSHYALDTRPFDEGLDWTQWNTCDLNHWLNHAFYSKAFTPNEQESILNIEHEIDFIGKSSEKIFLLSISEIEKYYHTPEDCKCIATPRTIDTIRNMDQAAWIDSESGGCFWWLRDLGYNELDAVVVGIDGELHVTGAYVGATGFCVRPAMWVSTNAGEIINPLG